MFIESFKEETFAVKADKPDASTAPPKEVLKESKLSLNPCVFIFTPHFEISIFPRTLLAKPIPEARAAALIIEACQSSIPFAVLSPGIYLKLLSGGSGNS